MGKILEIPSNNKYRKINLFWASHRDRLTRTLLVRSDLDLFELGLAIGSSLEASFDFPFSIKSKGETYFYGSDNIDDKYACEYDMSVLGKTFRFTYGFEEDYLWKFDCTLSKDEEVIETAFNPKVIVLEAKGQGIWEDGWFMLEGYLAGEIDPECDEEDPDMGYFFPSNIFPDKVGDFDKPIDIEKLNMHTQERMEEYEECLDGYDCYDDDEEQDEDEDDNPAFSFNSHEEVISFAIDSLFDAQVANNQFIRDKLSKLSNGEEYTPEAIEKVFEVFVRNLHNFILQDGPYSDEEFKKEIKKLK